VELKEKPRLFFNRGYGTYAMTQPIHQVADSF